MHGDGKLQNVGEHVSLSVNKRRLHEDLPQYANPSERSETETPGCTSQKHTESNQLSWRKSFDRLMKEKSTFVKAMERIMCGKIGTAHVS